jgi:signal transduction histidine kinase
VGASTTVRRPARVRRLGLAERLSNLDARGATIAAAVACALISLNGLFPPPQAASYATPSVRVALETVTTLIGLLAAYLVYGRYRISHSLSDFVLVCALVIVALKAMFFVGHHAVSPEDVDIFATWAQTVSVVLGAALLALSAFLPDRPIRHRRRVAVVLLALPLLLGLVAFIEAAVVPESHLGVEEPPRGATYELFQVGAAVLFVVAAVGFTRRAGRRHDELMRWLAVGATVAAAARLNYAVFPPYLNDRLYTGDILRLGFAVVLLVGAAREIQEYWRNRAETAVLEERRRLARDLHDGLAHELAFISSHARVLERSDEGDGTAARVGAAAERALDESRRAIAALTRPVDEPLEVALAQAAEDVAGRTGMRVRLDLEPGLEATPAGREALIRITREAVANAARHGQASTITVRLVASRAGLRLRVTDNGEGFDVSAAAQDRRGFGLISMRERAESLGGTFRIESTPGSGSRVEVLLP